MSNSEQRLKSVPAFQAVLLTHTSEVTSSDYSDCKATTVEALNHGNHRLADERAQRRWAVWWGK